MAKAWSPPGSGEMGGDSDAGGVHHVLCRAPLVTVPSPRGQTHQECDSIHRDLAHRTGDISPTHWRVTHCMQSTWLLLRSAKFFHLLVRFWSIFIISICQLVSQSIDSSSNERQAKTSKVAFGSGSALVLSFTESMVQYLTWDQPMYHQCMRPAPASAQHEARPCISPVWDAPMYQDSMLTVCGRVSGHQWPHGPPTLRAEEQSPLCSQQCNTFTLHCNCITFTLHYKCITWDGSLHSSQGLHGADMQVPSPRIAL